MEVMREKILKFLQIYIKKPEFYIPLFINIICSILLIICSLEDPYHLKYLSPTVYDLTVDFIISPLGMLIFWPLYLIIKKNRNINRLLFVLNIIIFSDIIFISPVILDQRRFEFEWWLSIFVFFFPLFYFILVSWDVIIQIIIRVFNYIKI